MKLWKVKVRRSNHLGRYGRSWDVDVLLMAETSDEALVAGREFAHGTAFFGAPNNQIEAVQAATVQLPYQLPSGDR